MTIEKRTTALIDQLQALKYPDKTPDTFLRTNFYPFSNERGISNPLQILKNTQPVHVPKNTIRVAILIGQSSFCSLIAALADHCDLAVCTDNNPYLMQHNQKLYLLLRTLPNRRDFETQYAEYVKGIAVKFTPSQAQPDLAMRKNTLGADHFLFNDETYQAAHQAAQKIRFAFSRVNLFNAENRKDFFSCFTRRKCEITFINLTNLYEWDAKISLVKLNKREQWQPKKQLTFIVNKMYKYRPIVMFSTRENAIESCPLVMQICFSFDEYFAKSKAAAQRFLATKFPTLSTSTSTSTTYISPIIKAIPNVTQTINSSLELKSESSISSITDKQIIKAPAITSSNILDEYLQRNEPVMSLLPMTNPKTYLPYHSNIDREPKPSITSIVDHGPIKKAIISKKGNQ